MQTVSQNNTLDTPVAAIGFATTKESNARSIAATLEMSYPNCTFIPLSDLEDDFAGHEDLEIIGPGFLEEIKNKFDHKQTATILTALPEEQTAAFSFNNNESKNYSETSTKPKVQLKRYSKMCHVCDKPVSKLERHMRTHTGVKPFQCDTCQTTFRQQTHLKDHQRTHTGERPFKCDICLGNFAHKCSLKRHLRKHSDEQLF